MRLFITLLKIINIQIAGGAMKKHQHMMEEIPVYEAVGKRLAHDLTKISPGEFKGRAFKAGQIIKEEDIPELLKIGKENLYILHIEEGYLHENEAAIRLAKAFAGENISLSEPSEGKITLRSKIFGLAKINEELVHQINRVADVALATIRTDTVVYPEGKLAGTRALPLIIAEDNVKEVEKIAAHSPVVTVLPFQKMRIGLLTTGNEVFYGRIKDKFRDILNQKVAPYSLEIVEQRFAPDDHEIITANILDYLASNVDMVFVTGGMSVDPDDRTPLAIKNTGAEVITYGTPILPGSMFMLAYYGNKPILGLPGGVIHDPYTAFDVILPRVLTGERLTKEKISLLGYGGYYGC